MIQPTLLAFAITARGRSRNCCSTATVAVDTCQPDPVAPRQHLGFMPMLGGFDTPNGQMPTTVITRDYLRPNYSITSLVSETGHPWEDITAVSIWPIGHITRQETEASIAAPPLTAVNCREPSSQTYEPDAWDPYRGRLGCGTDIRRRCDAQIIDPVRQPLMPRPVDQWLPTGHVAQEPSSR
jgi:hypothetical protein